jgi:NAD(P)-dependent dehydrogenase (short-subunit alcohol dehydrogenase family)
MKMIENEAVELLDDEFLFYSHLYSSITIVFAMAVFSKFLTTHVQFGFRGFVTLVMLFIGEPLCHFLLRGPSGVIIFGIGCLLVYSILPASHLPAAGKNILVTGCDSGFGHALAKELDNIGAVVYAGCLCTTSQGAKELKSVCSDRLKVVQLDVTDERQIAEAKEFVQRNVGHNGLWGVVNNAGIWYMSEIEMTSENVFRRIIDVNLFGLIRVTKAFLPLIRKSKGRIVNMSSVTGHMPFACFGAYCISKSAIETYSDVLRLEMKKWDVKVSTIVPVAFKTAAISPDVVQDRKAEIWKTLDEAAKATYGEAYLERLYMDFQSSFPKYPSDLSPVVTAMRSALLSKSPSAHYMVGRGAHTLLSVYSLLPVRLADRLAMALSISPRDLKPLDLQR